eukprot:1758592-Amphidinium_carterae.1
MPVTRHSWRVLTLEAEIHVFTYKGIKFLELVMINPTNSTVKQDTSVGRITRRMVWSECGAHRQRANISEIYYGTSYKQKPVQT